MTRIKSNRIILPDGFFSGYIYFSDGKIVDVTDKEYPVETEIDATDDYVSPGFIDIHTHGGGGYPFEGSIDDIVNACNFHIAHGATSICPTISAAPFQNMAASVARVKDAMTDPRVKGTIIGAHLEGPYLSRSQTGAQCADHITSPVEDDYLPLLEEFASFIARWTYAPENDCEGRFAKALKKYGVVASAGHTDALYGDMRQAVDSGCQLITHLYSCTSTITRDHGFRRLGVIESAWLMDELFVEIICDGKHLPPELIQLIYKIKGADRIALVTDSLALTGTARTHGFMQDTEFIIEDGVCKLMDRSAFAGSVATADRLLRVAVQDAGIPLLHGIKMLTEIPARIMGLSQKGKLIPGMDADIVILGNELKIKRVIASGNIVMNQSYV